MYLLGILQVMMFLATFFAPPIAALIWFGISLYKYFRTPKENTEIRRKKKRMLIISAITAAVIVGAFITVITLFLVGLSHM